MTVGQVYAIADAIKPRHRGLVLLAAFTALRLGELRALRCKRLDLDAGTVTVAPDDGNVQRDRHGSSHFGRPKSRAGARTVAILRRPLIEEIPGPRLVTAVATEDRPPGVQSRVA